MPVGIVGCFVWFVFLFQVELLIWLESDANGAESLCQGTVTGVLGGISCQRGGQDKITNR